MGNHGIKFTMLNVSYIWISRGVETVGPVSPVGHGHLRSDFNAVLPVQMSERALEYLKCYFGYIFACTGSTVKYDL